MKNSMKKQLLLIDNDPDYRHSLRSLLELENFIVEEAMSVEEAREKLSPELDLVLVDLRLTQEKDDYDFSGLEVAKEAAKMNIPCILITAYPSVEVVRLALRARGAEPLTEDMVPKSSGPQAILDAISVVLRNHDMTQNNHEPKLKIDIEQKLVFLKGEPLELSKYQYAFMAYLFNKDGAVCDPEELTKFVYDESTSEKSAVDRRLEHLVERLREKIEEDPSNPKHLLKVHGRGFRLVIDD